DEAALVTAFEAAYRTLFGRVIEGLAVEVTNWSLTVATSERPTPRVPEPETKTEAPVARMRTVFDAALRAHVEAKEVVREAMEAGAAVDGPAVIVETETSTIVPAAYRAEMQTDGALMITRKEATR
ncbi:MAG: hydantoinase/oxoprolinase family protein, partial [Pseudomonadota bacterium]